MNTELNMQIVAVKKRVAIFKEIKTRTQIPSVDRRKCELWQLYKREREKNQEVGRHRLHGWIAVCSVLSGWLYPCQRNSIDDQGRAQSVSQLGEDGMNDMDCVFSVLSVLWFGASVFTDGITADGRMAISIPSLFLFQLMLRREIKNFALNSFKSLQILQWMKLQSSWAKRANRYLLSHNTAA